MPNKETPQEASERGERENNKVREELLMNDLMHNSPLKQNKNTMQTKKKKDMAKKMGNVKYKGHFTPEERNEAESLFARNPKLRSYGVGHGKNRGEVIR